MYIVLTGAKKNIGDFLITDRSKKLLSHLKPKENLVQFPSWIRLDDHLDTINSSSAIIILGGPGFQPKFYPGVYKLTDDLNKIKVPIIPLGLGWKGITGDYYSIKTYGFSKNSLNALYYISKNTNKISCRDYITKQVLNSQGIKNVIMTGCPVWYDLDSIGKKMIKPKTIKKIIFTPAQRQIYRNQCISIMRSIRKRFQDVEIYCSFHRGINSKDIYTRKNDAINNMKIKNEAEKLNFKIIDASFELNKIQFYENCDFHIGYRLHAHLYFLSKRKPSFLIHEDGRGNGASDALGLRGFDAYKRNIIGIIQSSIAIPFIPKTLQMSLPTISTNPLLSDQLLNFIDEEICNDFERFSGVPLIIDSHFEVMKNFIINM